MAVCLNHTNIEAVTRCAACGKPLCSACIAVRNNGGDYCSESCCGKAQAAAAKAGGVISEKASTGRSKGIRFLIVLFLIIAAAAAGFMYYQNNKKAVQRRVNAAIRQTKAAAAETVSKTGTAIKKETKSVQKKLDTDSKYKRTRENLVK